MGGGRTLLDGEAPPRLVYWAISVRYRIARFAVFSNDKLQLGVEYLLCLPAIHGSAFPSFHREVSARKHILFKATASAWLCLFACFAGRPSAATSPQGTALQATFYTTAFNYQSQGPVAETTADRLQSSQCVVICTDFITMATIYVSIWRQLDVFTFKMGKGVWKPHYSLPAIVEQSWRGAFEICFKNFYFYFRFLTFNNLLF